MDNSEKRHFKAVLKKKLDLNKTLWGDKVSEEVKTQVSELLHTELSGIYFQAMGEMEAAEIDTSEVEGWVPMKMAAGGTITGSKAEKYIDPNTDKLGKPKAESVVSQIEAVLDKCIAILKA